MSTSKRQKTVPEKDGYHHGNLRRALIDAAAKIVAAQGAAAVTLREVARLAGVSHNAPYRHFDSLSALLAAVAAQGFEEFAQRLESAAADRPKQRLKAMGQAYVAFALDNPKLYLLMFGAELDRAKFPELRAASGRAFDLLHGATSRPGRAGQAEAIRAWAFVHGLAHLIIDKQVKPNDPALAGLFDR